MSTFKANLKSCPKTLVNPNVLGNVVNTLTASFAISSSYAATASYASDLTVGPAGTITFDGTLTDYSSVASSINGPNNLDHVASPTIPSSFNPFAFCHALTAASVFGPNVPIASTPNFSWSFFTSSPLDPFFNNIFNLLCNLWWSHLYTINIIFTIISYMKKRQLLQRVINHSLKNQLTLMYGEGSYISIDLLDYIRSKKSYLVHAKLYLTDVEDGMKLYPEGVHMLINLGWKVVGQGKPLMILPSVDVK